LGRVYLTRNINMKNRTKFVRVLSIYLIIAFGVVVFQSVLLAGEGEEKSKSGFLGIYPREIDNAMREALDFEEAGILVEDVVKDGPSDQAGLMAGDIILEVNGIKMFNVDRLHKIAGRSTPGDKAAIAVLRDGKKKKISVTVGEREEPEHFFMQNEHGDMNMMFAPENKKKMKQMKKKMKKMKKEKCCPTVWIGVKLDDLSEQLGDYFGVSKGEGILVSEVITDSPAEKAGLNAGDVIVEVEGNKITSASDIHNALMDKKPGEETSVGLIRDKKSINKKVTLEEPPEDWGLGFEGFDKDIHVMVNDILEDMDFDFDFDFDVDQEDDQDHWIMDDDDGNLIIIEEHHDHQGDGTTGNKLPE